MRFAAFRHHTAREGFEVVFLGDRRYEGHSVGVEDGRPYAVRYAIEVDERRHTRRARIGALALEGDGEGHWRVDGDPDPRFDGCLDVDLEASAFTNAFPVAREATDAPAVYVRAFDASLLRLEQRYERTGERTWHYVCERFDADLVLTFAEDGIVADYPGLATRVR